MKDIFVFVLSFAFYWILAMIVRSSFFPVFLVLCIVIRMILECHKRQRRLEHTKPGLPILEAEVLSETEIIESTTLEDEILKRYR